MSVQELAIIIVGALIALGIVGDVWPKVLRGRADLELARNGIRGYTADVVHTAVRGALIVVADVDVDTAERQADLVVAELEQKGVVFDGHDWRPIARP